jgi:anti-sigma B factor antagonist
MTSKCEVVVRANESGDLAVLELTGEVDGSAELALSAGYDRAVAETSPTTVLLDFTGVDYINSTGIALIVGVLAKARAQRRTVVACGLSDHYRQIFVITRLADFVQIYDDRAAVDAVVAG